MTRAWMLGAAAVATLACAACGEPVRVVIPPGSSLRDVTDSLAHAGLVSAPRLFRVYARIGARDRGVRTGTFVLPRWSSWSTILDSLTRGQGVSAALTVPEGLSLAAIESLMVSRMNVSVESAASATRDAAMLERLGLTVPTLEGYLFPDTYMLPEGTTAEAAVRTMVSRFENVWQPEWDARLAELGMTRHEAVTLASIVEKEAVVGYERPIISAVYHNRMRIGMPLQADPTILYAKGAHAERVFLKDLEIDSPYNTYRNPGLPPGPIASPGAESLRAALYPADVRYLYFVAHPDGHHEFRNTYQQHLQAKARVDRLRRDSGRAPR